MGCKCCVLCKTDLGDLFQWNSLLVSKELDIALEEG